jgi:excisionase family DNA binding protein
LQATFVLWRPRSGQGPGTATVRHVRRLVAERRLPYYKVGRLVRFDSAEIAQWLQTRRIG